MSVTGACAEVVYLDGSIEPDYDRHITDQELVDALNERTRALDPSERDEVDLRGDDAFGL